MEFFDAARLVDVIRLTDLEHDDEVQLIKHLTVAFPSHDWARGIRGACPQCQQPLAFRGAVCQECAPPAPSLLQAQEKGRFGRVWVAGHLPVEVAERYFSPSVLLKRLRG